MACPTNLALQDDGVGVGVRHAFLCYPCWQRVSAQMIRKSHGRRTSSPCYSKNPLPWRTPACSTPSFACTDNSRTLHWACAAVAHFLSIWIESSCSRSPVRYCAASSDLLDNFERVRYCAASRCLVLLPVWMPTASGLMASCPCGSPQRRT